MKPRMARLSRAARAEALDAQDGLTRS